MKRLTTVGRAPRLTLLAAILCCGIAPAQLLANGDQTLGPPDIGISRGSAVMVAGAGMESQPAVVTLTIPTHLTVEQVLLYFQGRAGRDNTIVIQSIDPPGIDVELEGQLIGRVGPGEDANPSYTYRVDVTALGLIQPGMTNRFEASGLDFSYSNSGVGIFVIVDDGVNTTDIHLLDGCDFALQGSSGPSLTTVPQTLNFAPEDKAHTAELFFLVGDAQRDRPDVLELTYGSGLSERLCNVFVGVSGAKFDVVTLPITIPADETELTVQLLSEGCDGEALTRQPDALTWNLVSLLRSHGRMIGDTVYCDENANGVQDPGEPGIKGVDVALRCVGADGIYENEDDFRSRATTDANGYYLFSNIPDQMGECAVKVRKDTVPPGCDVLDRCPPRYEIDFLHRVAMDSDFCFSPSSLPPPSECALEVVKTCEVAGRRGEVCEVVLPGSKDPKCSGLKSLTFAYTGGGCAASDNDQRSDWCFGRGVDSRHPVLVLSPRNRHVIVAPGGEFTLRNIKKYKQIILLKNRSGIEIHKIIVSGSQPLNVGDVFGSLTLVAIDDGMTRAEVTYHYDVTNAGTVPMTDVHVMDDPLGHIAGPLEMGPGETVALSKTTTITETTTNTVEVIGVLADSGAECVASDSATVHVLKVRPEPKPKPKECKPKKPKKPKKSKKSKKPKKPKKPKKRRGHDDD